MSPAKLARVEAVAEREIDALLAQPDFQELLAALAEMAELPEEERLRQLEQMAWCVLEMALADSDWRAAAFIADQMRRGCHPARSLAKAVIAAQARAAAPPPAEPKPARPRRSRPYDAVDAAMGRAASGLRAILGLEAALRPPAGAEGGRAQRGAGRERAARQAPPRQRPDRPAQHRHRRPPARSGREPPAWPIARLGAGTVAGDLPQCWLVASP